MLHIVNGDSFGKRLKESGISGEIHVWRESLYDGPVGLDLADPAVIQDRSLYMAAKYGICPKLFTDTTLQQEQSLRALGADADVVLWFEHDLFDQLILCYLLHKFNTAGLNGLFLLSINSFPGVKLFQGLGQLTPEQVSALDGKWKAVTSEQLVLGSRAWEAYVSSDPLAAEHLIGQDCTALPYLKDAMLTHLRRFPSVKNGLSQIQQLVLELVNTGETSLLNLFGRMGELANGYGLGDLQFWGILDKLRSCSVPLVTLIGGERLPRFEEKLPQGFEFWRLELTEAGSQVMNSGLDHIHLNGINDWFGGVHLSGKGAVWRWNEKEMRVLNL